MSETDHIAAVRRDALAYGRICERRKRNIAAAVAAGLMMRDIANAADIDAAYVRKIARDAGIEPRQPGRRPKGKR